MNKTEKLKNALELFQPGSADTPILLSATQHNDKAFRALLGRKAKYSPVHSLEWILAGAVIIAIIAFIVGFHNAHAGAGGSLGGLFTALYIMYFHRTTLIAADERGIDFYYAEKIFARKEYVVYEKITLPYDRITNMKVKKGRFNTTFRFEFSHKGKTIKLVTHVPNKKRKLEEQGANLNSFLEKVTGLQTS